MPSLVVCGTKTPFSGDDLRFFCICTLLFRALQLAVGLALIAFATAQGDHIDQFEDKPLQCDLDGEFSSVASEGVTVMYAQAATSISLSFFDMGATIATYLVSMKGTPTDPVPRQSLQVLCLFNLSVVNLFRVASFGMAIFAIRIFQEYCDCVEAELVQFKRAYNMREACPDRSLLISILLALVATHVVDFALVIVELLYFANPCTTCPTLLPSESKWRILVTCCIGCFSTVTCCMFGGREALQGDFGDLALVMNNYANNNQALDVTASDIAAGLIMVIRRQREKLLEARARVHFSFHSRVDEDLVKEPAPIKQGPRQRSYSDPNVADGKSSALERRGALRKMASTPDLQATEMAIGGVDQETIKFSKRELLQPGHQREKVLMAEAARFVPLAYGIYSLVIFLVDNPFLGIIRLCYLSVKRCACLSPSPKDKVFYDYLWEPHMLALQHMSGLDPDDIVFVSFKQSIVAAPYMISLDHEWRSVVIAIRGTLSMESIIADIAIRPKELKVAGEKCGFDGSNKYCHRGTLASTLWIYDDIVKRGKLKEVMEGEYQTYRLRVVGHSLGAGCAALLSLLLRPQYPNIRCLTFSPPGCVFSEELAEECSAWVTGFVLDADIVPRLAIKSFEELRDSILKMICRITVPKNEVFALSKGSRRTKDELAEENRRILCSEDEIPESNFKRQVDRFLEFQEELKQRSEPASYIDLFPPGEIIQLLRTQTSNKSWPRIKASKDVEAVNTATKNWRTERGYIARWIHRDDLQHIVVSPHLFGDHFIANIKRQLQEVSETKFDLRPPCYKPYADVESGT